MDFFGNMRYGRASGIWAVLIFIVFAVYNFYSIINNQTYSPKLVVTGIIMLFLGISLILFPGGNFTRNDYKGQRIGIKFIWTQAPVMHRAIWCTAVICGVISGMQMNRFLGQ
ncbi:MAG: hypothetical protein JW982_00920 [Spirochaetes bacterium]|nr:hypothetical protein [Spirochaetota bacterium]